MTIDVGNPVEHGAPRGADSPGRALFWSLLSLLVVLACALVLRRLFVTGLVFRDDLGYSQAARDLLSGHVRMREWPGGQARIALYAPVALCYLLFGRSEGTTLLFPLLSSLGSVVVVYGIARTLADEAAGLIAAFIWATLPLDVQAATALLPDGPVTAFSGAAVWLFLRAELVPSGSRSLRYLGAAACLVFAILIKPVALIFVLFALVYLIAERRFTARTLLFATALVVAGALHYAYYMYLASGASQTAPALPPVSARLAQTATDWTHRLLSEPAFAAFSPLAITAVVALLMRPDGRSRIVLLLAGCTFLYFELGTISLVEYLPISADFRAGQVLFVLLPFAVAIGIYLRHAAPPGAVAWAVGVAAAVVALVAWLYGRHGPFVSWSVTGVALSELPFARMSGMCSAVAVFGAICSPLLAYTKRARGALPLGVLLMGVGVASLHPSQIATLALRDAWHSNFRDVAAFLTANPGRLVFIENNVAGERLDVAADFTIGFDYWRPTSGRSRLRVAPADVTMLPAGSFVVVDDEHRATSGPAGLGAAPAYVAAPPVDWPLVFVTGPARGHRTRVYEVRRPAPAQNSDTR